MSSPIQKVRKKKSLILYHFLIENLNSVASAQFSSASILSISYSYIKQLGNYGLKKSTLVAMINANYLAKILKDHYKILFTGETGFVAHEFIIDLKEFKV